MLPCRGAAASAESELKSPRDFSEWKPSRIRLGAVTEHLAIATRKRRSRAPARPKLRVAPPRVTLKTVRAGLHRLI
jgi:hypothetical protein